MVAIPFAEFAPDQARFDSPYTAMAKNVLPAQDGYRPMPGPADPINLLPEAPRGVFCDRYLGSTIRFFGSSTRLWKLDAGASWLDVSGLGFPYGASENRFWSFVRFGNLLIAGNGFDDLQKFNLDSGTEFEPLGGGPPDGHVLSIHKNFLVTFENQPDDTTLIGWSGFNNPEIWDGTLLQDQQPIVEGGPGMSLVTGENILFFQQAKIHRGVFTSDPTLVFSFDELETERGCVGPRAVVAHGPRAYFASYDGLYAIDWTGAVTPIGAGKVNEFFIKRVDRSTLSHTMVKAHPRLPLIFFFYKTGSAPAEVYNETLVFDWLLNKWSFLAVNCFDVYRDIADGLMIDDVEGMLDEFPGSFDEPQYAGGGLDLGIITANLAMRPMSGPPLAATLETAPYISPALTRKMLSRVYPIIDVNEVRFVTIYATTQERPGGAVTESPGSKILVNRGWAQFRHAGRAMRGRIEISDQARWTRAQSVELVLQELGA